MYYLNITFTYFKSVVFENLADLDIKISPNILSNGLVLHFSEDETRCNVFFNLKTNFFEFITMPTYLSSKIS